jgi:hypothetical protein
VDETNVVCINDNASRNLTLSDEAQSLVKSEIMIKINGLNHCLVKKKFTSEQIVDNIYVKERENKICISYCDRVITDCSSKESSKKLISSYVDDFVDQTQISIIMEIVNKLLNNMEKNNVKVYDEFIFTYLYSCDDELHHFLFLSMTKLESNEVDVRLFGVKFSS